MLKYENVVPQIARVIMESGLGPDDMDECLDYADGVFHDLGAVNVAIFRGLVFVEREDAIEVSKEDGGFLVEIK